MRYLLYSLALIATPTVGREADGFAEIWGEFGSQLEADGIDRPMANAAYLWTELQYHLGICRAHLSKSDLTFWRQWWKDTALEKSAFGRKILAAGDEEFFEGNADSRTQTLSAKQCQRVMNSWFADMKAALPPK